MEILFLGLMPTVFFALQAYKYYQELKRESKKNKYRFSLSQTYEENLLLEKKKFHNSIIHAFLTATLSLGVQISVEIFKESSKPLASQPMSQTSAKTKFDNWVPNSPHPKYRNVIASNTKGKWIAAPGYKLVKNNSGLKGIWTPGHPHPQYKNVIASERERVWIPAPGYMFVTNNNKADLRVKPNSIEKL